MKGKDIIEEIKGYEDRKVHRIEMGGYMQHDPELEFSTISTMQEDGTMEQGIQVGIKNDFNVTEYRANMIQKLIDDGYTKDGHMVIPLDTWNKLVEETIPKDIGKLRKGHSPEYPDFKAADLQLMDIDLMLDVMGINPETIKKQKRMDALESIRS